MGGIVPGGNYALQIGDATSEAVTKTLNASECPEVRWQYRVLRQGSPAPSSTQTLSLEYETSAGWVVANTLSGIDTADTQIIERMGTITDPAALTADLSFRLTSTANSGSTFLVDDIVLGCPLDLSLIHI